MRLPRISAGFGSNSRETGARTGHPGESRRPALDSRFRGNDDKDRPMHRLFVAIRPPTPIRARLLDAMGGVSGARWQSEAQLHLTLRFIGEVDRHVAGDVHAALGGIRQAPFEIALNGIGSFDRRGQAETLWAGVAPQDPLKALHNKIDAALLRVGIAPDQRAFLPHITLARLKRASGPVGNLLGQSGGLASPPFTVDGFGLFESVLTPEAAAYSIIARYRLD
jgi:2'-5' RNA ligase